MALFQCKGHEYRYNPSLWEVVELSKEEQEEYEYTHTIKYIGPVIDGRVLEPVPDFPVYVDTFAGLIDLVHMPEGMTPYYAFNAFTGCVNFAPTKEELIEFNESLCSGLRQIHVFDGCNSPHIVDAKCSYKNGYEALARMFGVTESIIRSKLKNQLVEYEEEYMERETGLRSLLNDLRTDTILKILDSFDDGEISHIIFSTGAIIIFDSASKSSEFKHCASGATKSHALAQNSRSILRLTEGVTYCYRLSPDFVIDSDDRTLIKVFGRKLCNTHMEISYKAGDNDVIETYGYSSIESYECPVQASGTLTIKGSGILELKCKDSMQACIGTNTHVGMSYGRWEPGRDRPLEEIIIDGVQVICESPEKTFSLGNYGTNQMPKVTLRDGGRLLCPEMHGARVMLKSGAEGLCGSTKREHSAEYAIVDGSPFTVQNDTAISKPERMEL